MNDNLVWLDEIDWLWESIKPVYYDSTLTYGDNCFVIKVMHGEWCEVRNDFIRYGCQITFKEPTHFKTIEKTVQDMTDAITQLIEEEHTKKEEITNAQ